MQILSPTLTFIIDQRAATVRTEAAECADRAALIRFVGGRPDWWDARASRLTAALARLEAVTR